MEKVRIGILGASGYTGAELLRLLSLHPAAEIVVLTADRHAGQLIQEVFPHLSALDLPELTRIEESDWHTCDVVYCALPHGTTQEVVAQVLDESPDTRVIDLSADFRLADVHTYAHWYGQEHKAPEIQPQAVYGLTEIYRDDIAGARLVANPGCYTTTAQLPLIPLIEAGAIQTDDIIIDAKSGVSGAGRGEKRNILHAEVSEGIHAYSVGEHRHAPEIEQGLSRAAGQPVTVNFTPHLMPMNRGILASCYVKLAGGADAAALREVLKEKYDVEPFVHVVAEGVSPVVSSIPSITFMFWIA